MGKLKKSRIIACLIAILAVAAIVVLIINTDFETVDEHASNASNEALESVTDGISVSILINYSTVFDNYENLSDGVKNAGVLRDDGVLLDKTTVVIEKGKSVYDLLEYVCRVNDIAIEYNGSTYVQGIGYLYEYDCGPISGWMYKVNGIFPRDACGDYILEDGDEVEWRYTCDLGRDLGDQYYNMGD
ncbi:MAG: DUF4430 domain-containing protein [Lachnospiraceae bacterium]|nr:DUF4430 domain-containing protein [Lachnospiraceae bacterium]